MKTVYTQVLVSLDNNILYLTINRPDKMNALNAALLAEIAEIIIDANLNEQVKGILLTGAGEKAFVAGADISEFQNYTSAEGENLAARGQENVFNAIERSSKPIVAAINGFALGGGLELAMACHIRVASENAKMGLPEVTLGLIPGYGGTQRLPQLVGKSKAMEMILTADMITAQEALTVGLVSKVVPINDLLKTAETILNKILQRAPLAIASAITAVNAAYNHNVNGYEIEIKEFAKCFDTEDFKEGVNAFLGKRKAVFSAK